MQLALSIETAIAMGTIPVDPEAVEEAIRHGLLRQRDTQDDGALVILDNTRGPAVGLAAARACLGTSAQWLGFNALGHSVYRRTCN